MTRNTNINTKEFFLKAVNEIIIDPERTTLLNSIAQFIIAQKSNHKNVHLNFICTHNSRRSQLAQVWAHYVIQYHKLVSIKSYSGGTEVTAFHKNTIKTLQDVGFKFEHKPNTSQNPIYKITYKDIEIPITGFSKIYDDRENKKPFIAITTCSSAEENCPFIPDAVNRFHVGYIDPKKYDNTTKMQEEYLKTNMQIAVEMNYLFKQVSVSQ
ncbi:MAG: hypothetical protein KUG51_03480 [Urechidicola sp.]|nr:hypothetical protein [Urechidicola sp.]